MDLLLGGGEVRHVARFHLDGDEVTVVFEQEIDLGVFDVIVALEQVCAE